MPVVLAKEFTGFFLSFAVYGALMGYAGSR